MVEKEKGEKRLDAKDFKKVEQHLKSELDLRKKAEFRTKAEQRWKEVDRQVALDPMMRVQRDGSEVDQGWHNVFELGELARASETITADVTRIIFPQARSWFEGHSEIKGDLDVEGGEEHKDPEVQVQVDGRLRAFMTQQHTDFGLKDRVELSIKEALHHGSFAAEVEWETMEMVYEGTKVKVIGSPVWKPYSMWNCFPDPSPSIIGANMFYNGSIFFESYLPRYKAEQLVKSGESGWFPKNWDKVKKDEHNIKDNKVKDVKITTYYGDINIDRSDGDLFYPNHKVMLMNGTLVFMKASKLPFSPVIYRGYEKQDVRDPYFTSPIIKMSPMQKMATVLANKYVDGIELHIEPPIVYDGTDPQFVMDGGPRTEPGAKSATKGSANFQQLVIGDPNSALQGLQMTLAHMKETLGRTGQPIGNRATAEEVQKKAQDEEVGVVGFISRLEPALRAYLYMQHEMNKTELTEYSFYDQEMNQPDFIRIKKADLPQSVHFEIVGAKGILGERQRAEKATAVTAFASGHPMFAPLLKPAQILKQMYQDAGVKNPEAWMKNDSEGENPEVTMIKQQAQQAITELKQALAEESKKANDKIAGLQQKAHKAEQDAGVSREKMQLEHAEKMQAMSLQYNAKIADIEAKLQVNADKITAQLVQARDQMANDLAIKLNELVNAMPKHNGEGPAPKQPDIHVHMPNGSKKIMKADGTVLGTVEMQ